MNMAFRLRIWMDIDRKALINLFLLHLPCEPIIHAYAVVSRNERIRPTSFTYLEYILDRSPHHLSNSSCPHSHAQRVLTRPLL